MLCASKSRHDKMSVLISILILSFVSSAHAQTAAALARSTVRQPAIHQLRIYQIFDHNKQALHDRFRDHAVRIMKKCDFNVAMWESKRDERTEFVYILEWPDEQTMKARWAQFMADKEWSDIKRESSKVHGRLVGEIQDRTLELTPYSPRTVLTN